MVDQSHLDSRYFVDERVYNCPFCNRRHVAYHVCDVSEFEWSQRKLCTAFFVICESCGNRSMHLTFSPPPFTYIASRGNNRVYRFDAQEGVDMGVLLDNSFFYSVPTSFFVLDERVPRPLRELLTEAEGSLKSNFLTGASACARKIVYELGELSGATGDNYEDRIKSLKDIHPEVD